MASQQSIMMNTYMMNSNMMTNNSGYLNNEGFSCMKTTVPEVLRGGGGAA